MISQLRRYFNSAKIFSYFIHHPYIYFSIFRDLAEKNFHLCKYHKPRNVVLKLDSRCNAKCAFCYAKHDESGEKLSLEAWKKVIDSAKEVGCYTVTLSGGEPLIYPHLLELIRYIKKKNMLSFTTTNGLIAKPELLKKLEEAGLCALNWSLHGPQEYHDKIVGVPGAFNKILENGEYSASKTNLINIVNHVCTRESLSKGYYDYVWETMKDRGFRALNLLPVCISSTDKSDLLDEEMLRTYDTLSQYDYVLMDTKNYALPLCPAGREDIFISDTGEIQPCPFIPVSFGNVRDQPLLSLFLSIQNHAMFSVPKNVCVAARDHEFIDANILPAFTSGKTPIPISELKRPVVASNC